MHSISSRIPSRLRPSHRNQEQPVFTTSRDSIDEDDRIPPPSPGAGTYLTGTLNDSDIHHRWNHRTQRPASLNGDQTTSYF